jgi:hypothetical protein
MIVLFLAAAFCNKTEKDKKKDLLTNKIKEQSVFRKTKNISSPNNFRDDVDSIACYAAYTAAIASISAITAKKQNHPQLKTAADDFQKFQDECVATVGVQACSEWIEDLGTLVAADAADLTANCAVTRPAADAADCYSAYATLINTLEGLPSMKRHIPELKTVASDYTNFKNKCPTTVHSAACSAILVVFDAAGPAASNTGDIKAKCAVSAPAEDPKKDAGSLAITASSSLILLSMAMAEIYFFL